MIEIWACAIVNIHIKCANAALPEMIFISGKRKLTTAHGHASRLSISTLLNPGYLRGMEGGGGGERGGGGGGGGVGGGGGGGGGGFSSAETVCRTCYHRS